jgi:hypothetical protein
VTFPLKAAFGNVLIGPDGTAAALYRVQTVSYPFLSDRDKRDLLSGLAMFAYTADADFSIYRVSRAYPADQYVQQAMHQLDPRAPSEPWEAFLRTHEARLEELRPFIPEVYLIVQLKTGDGAGVRNAVGNWWDGVRGRSTRGPLLKSRVEALRDAEERVHARTNQTVHADRATTRELQWLLRRCAVRGVSEPFTDENWKPQAVQVDGAYQPLEWTLERHGNQPVHEHERHLVVDADEAQSHQAMLTLGALPEYSEFPGGAELLFTPLEGLSFPVDAVMHCRFIPNRDAITKVRRKVVDADNAFKDERQSEHGSLSVVTDENRTLARELDAYLRSHEHPPLLNVATSFAVGADSRETLEKRVEQLRARYGSVSLHRPHGLQPALYLDHFPRVDTGAVREYQDMLTKEQFGALMPIGTHQAGSDRGPYVGHTLSAGSRPVKHDLTEASPVHPSRRHTREREDDHRAVVRDHRGVARQSRSGH